MCDGKLDRWRSVPKTWTEVKARLAVEHEIADRLQRLAVNPEMWVSVYREIDYPNCFWGAEYPYAEMHGGGPKCFYPLHTSDPDVWLAHVKPVIYPLIAESGE